MPLVRQQPSSVRAQPLAYVWPTPAHQQGMTFRASAAGMALLFQPESARQEIFLAHPPCIPAWNKWTKLYPPVLYWAVLMQMSTLLPSCLAAACGAIVSDDGVLDPELLVGLDEKKVFEKQELCPPRTPPPHPLEAEMRRLGGKRPSDAVCIDALSRLESRSWSKY